MGILDMGAGQLPATGLLALDPNDRQQAVSLGLLALAGGMVRGDFGGGLTNAGNTIMSAQNSAVDRADKMQQIGLRNMQLQQAQQQWQMMQPIYKAMSDAYGQQPQTPSQPAIAATPGGAMGSGTFGIPTGGQPQAAPAAQGGSSAMNAGGSMFGLPMNVAGPILALGGPSKLAEAVSAANSPTDFQKMLAASGVDPNSPLGRQMIQSNIAKQNYVAPVNARPGSILRDPFSSRPVAYNPHVPDGTAPVFDANGNVKEFQPIGNAEAALALGERARGFGKAQATPSVVYGQDNTPRFSTVAQDLGRAGDAAPATSGAQSVDTDAAKIYGKELQDAQQRLTQLQTDPRATPDMKSAAQHDVDALTRLTQKYPQSAAPASAAATPVTPTLKPGAAQGATLSQDELSKKWTDLNTMNNQAQTTKSYLDSIKQLAPQAAVGQFADKQQFVNSVLSYAGVSDKATDEVTAKNLLDKYSQQIVSRLGGSGGLSTDAARAILQAAYPNSHMTPAAITEAADNLIGANAMIQAKARYLQSAATARDPAAYQQREVAFDQAADPRLWQLQSMDAGQAKNFLFKMPPAVRADLQKRAAALKQAGVF